MDKKILDQVSGFARILILRRVPFSDHRIFQTTLVDLPGSI